jgi:signal transduction histidine kinase
MVSFFLLLSIELLLGILGLLIISKNHKSKVNIYFTLLTSLLGVWLAIIYFEDISSIEVAAILVKFDFFVAIILASVFTLFCLNFPFKRNNRMKDYYILITSLPLSFMAFTPLVVEGISKTNNIGVQYDVGSFFYIYIFYIGILIFLGILSLWYKHYKSRGLVRTQIQYVLYGASITAIVLLFLNALIPRVISIGPEITRIGIYSTAIFVFSVFYAIVKHRLMDIRLVVAKSVTYTLVLVLLAGFYAGSVLAIERMFFPSEIQDIDYVQAAVRTFLAVVMAFSFQPLKRWITRRTDKIFFKNAYSTEQLLDTLSHTLSSTIVLVELLYKVTDILIDQMKISRGMFILLKGEDRIYTHLATGYKDQPKIELNDVLKLAKNGTAVYDELEENSHFKTLLRKFEASVSIPLKTEKELVGVFLVGEKSSGDMFSQGDLRILEILGPEISVAIENARSYEEINRFNVTLRNEVNRATKRLKEKNEQLRELDIAKDEFISMASHQLRTPLTAIKGYLSMLLDGDAGEIKVGQYDFIHEAYAGANRMVGLINDLLNVSRMETGRFFIEPIEVDIVQATSEEAKQFATTAKEKGIYLRLDVVGKIPHVWVDEMKIRQVIMNLIDNAVHYTQKGGVTAKLYKDKHDLIFEVTDTGIGIPKEQQHKLFEKFYRADNARHIRPDGTGLGIYLAKRVVEDHGGEIMFRSIENRGSTFGFKLPLSSITKQRAYTPPEKPKKKETKEIRPVRVEELLANKEVMDEPADLTGVKF